MPVVRSACGGCHLQIRHLEPYIRKLTGSRPYSARAGANFLKLESSNMDVKEVQLS